MPSRESPYLRPFRLRSRGSLIAATVLLQAVVVGLGWWGTLQLAKSGLASRIHEQVTEENTRAVNQLASALAKIAPGPIVQDSDEWLAAQKLVESFDYPGNSTLMVLDETGAIICHPQFVNHPRPRTPSPHPVPEGSTITSTVVTLLPGRETMFLSELNPGTVVTCLARWFGTEATLAVLWDKQAKIKIVAYQPESAIIAAQRRFSADVLFWASVLGVLVLGITILGSVVLVRRYDTIVMRFNRQLEEEVLRRTRRGLAIRNGLVFGLAKLADYRDTDTGRHLERICKYCELLAQQLYGLYPEIDRAWIERLKLASSMHDIGKVGIPDSILLKPGKLTPAERTQMETHAQIGADTLRAIRNRVGDDDLLNMSIEVALCHHEKFDGSGYPNRLVAEKIPLAARIVALADMYDALTSKRVYKEAMTHAMACETIFKVRGTHFDPHVADAFEAINTHFDAFRAELHPSPEEEAGSSLLALSVKAAEQARKAAA